MGDGFGGIVAAVLLGLAPLAVAYTLPAPAWIARTRGREGGIRFADTSALARARRVDTVLLDRWGTVTTGELRVSAVDPVEPDHDRNLRWFAGALEHAATDPVGRAVARLATRGRLSQVAVERGAGIRGSVDRHPVRVGRPDWVGMPERHDLGVTVGVEVDHRPIGYITVTDDIRLDAVETITRLRDDGRDPVLVSDDTARNTEHLADACGIEHWHAELAPEKRERLIVEHQERGHTVAFAGDAGRDPDALAAADLALTDTPGMPVRPGAIHLEDLDVRRVAGVLTLARSTHVASVRMHRTGLLVGLIGAVLAATGVLATVPAAAYAVVGALVTIGAGTLRIRT